MAGADSTARAAVAAAAAIGVALAAVDHPVVAARLAETVHAGGADAVEGAAAWRSGGAVGRAAAAAVDVALIAVEHAVVTSGGLAAFPGTDTAAAIGSLEAILTR